MIVQISSGQGPEECRLAVGKLFDALKKEFPDIREISAYPAAGKDCFYSVLFETDSDLRSLEGTVEWICRSPLRPGHKRKNWFVDVSVIPEIETVPDSGDYKIEKFHCGGKGGQNVNKVESGVRVIHIPTGLTAVSTEERSQYMNKKKAFQRIAALLEQKKANAGKKQTSQAWREHTRLVRGNPVRVYEGEKFIRKK